jgi:hypothetical protein
VDVRTEHLCAGGNFAKKRLKCRFNACMYIPRTESLDFSRVARWLYFHTKIPIWVRVFWSNLECKMFVHVVAVWNILQPFGECYGNLAFFSLLWYVVPGKIWQPSTCTTYFESNFQVHTQRRIPYVDLLIYSYNASVVVG